MKKLGLVLFALAALGAGRPLDPSSTDAGSDLSTDRRVHGVITAVEPGGITIASKQRAVTGRFDPVRTKVTIGGKPAKLADLQITAHAKGELCLDDIWVAIDAH